MIDPRAVVDPGASVAPDVTIGPYSIIGPNVEIGAGTRIGPHTVIQGPTRIGRDNQIFQFASIGDAPQDKKYQDEPTELHIGDGNTIREYCTINRGTVQGGGITRIGNDNWIMAYVHIAHDCQVGNHTIFANAASLAGHVNVGDWAILGGFTLVHQFCTLGLHCFTAFGSVIGQDVPPYVLVSGHMARPHGLNTEGLKRRGFSSETLRQLRQAYKVIYRSGLTLEQAIARLREMMAECPEIGLFVEALSKATRGIIR
ncbi:acyl-(acyl-carrier-protein)--UDP-N-acetylglucosamine O-acyltransferase [Gammaproteobacteria bacterium]